MQHTVQHIKRHTMRPAMQHEMQHMHSMQRTCTSTSVPPGITFSHSRLRSSGRHLKIFDCTDPWIFFALCAPCTSRTVMKIAAESVKSVMSSSMCCSKITTCSSILRSRRARPHEIYTVIVVIAAQSSRSSVEFWKGRAVNCSTADKAAMKMPAMHCR